MDRRGRALALGALMVSVALAGCTQTGGQSTDKIDSLESQVANLTREVETLEQDKRELQDRVTRLEDQLPPETGVDVRVKQDPGQAVYWVLPGPRRLSPTVFGTPGERRTTGAWQIQALRDTNHGALADIVEQHLPFLVGAPEDIVEVRDDGTMVYTEPTPFSDRGEIVTGSLDLTYKDRTMFDYGPPPQTQDEVDLDVQFTDPRGNDYTIELKQVFKPPIPSYETAGGVRVNGFHHGLTGTGTPLMPKVYTYGAFWALGDLVVNGTTTERNHVFHFMTTQNVRSTDGTGYELATDEDLPLPTNKTVGNQDHHTHGFFIPIEVTPEGPVFDPVNTSFVLENGQTQPFIHIMFEQDTIVEGPFEDTGDGDGTDETPGDADFVVEGSEWDIQPAAIDLTAGENVTVAFKNTGSIRHNWGIDVDGDGFTSDDVKTETIGPGEVDTVSFTAPESGQYFMYCALSGHRGAGMEGSVGVAGS